MQSEREVTHLRKGLIHHLDTFLHAPIREALRPVQLEFDGRQGLSDLVMKLSGNATPFGLLRFQQLTGKTP